MIVEILVQSFHDFLVKLRGQLLQVLPFGGLVSILLGILQDVLINLLLQLVSVFYCRELRQDTFNPIVIQVSRQSVKWLLDLGWDLLLLLFFLPSFFVLSRRFFQELGILFLEHHSIVLEEHCLVRSQHHSLDQVVFDFFEPEEFRYCGIDFGVDTVYLLEGSPSVDWNCCNKFPNQLFNIRSIHPKVFPVGRLDVDVEDHKLVIWCVIDPCLNCLGLALGLFWPVSTEVLPVQSVAFDIRICLLQTVEELTQFIVKPYNQRWGAIERFEKVGVQLLFEHRDIFCNEVVSPSVLHNHTIGEYREIGPVDLFRGHPLYFRNCKLVLRESIDEVLPR